MQKEGNRRIPDRLARRCEEQLASMVRAGGENGRCWEGERRVGASKLQYLVACQIRILNGGQGKRMMRRGEGRNCVDEDAVGSMLWRIVRLERRRRWRIRTQWKMRKWQRNVGLA